MEVGFEFGHVFDEEAAVLADGVAAHGRFAFADVFFKEGNEGGFGLGLGGGAGFDFVDEAAAFVGALVPCVHFGEEFVALVDD